MCNVGGGLECSLSLVEATELCREITGETIEIQKNEQSRPADVPLFIADSSKIMNRTGWRPQYSPWSTLNDILAG